MTPPEKMPLPTVKRALELGAAFIEIDLAKMRADARRLDEGGVLYPVTHSLEHDLMKASEWAAAAATLRSLARAEDR